MAERVEYGILLPPGWTRVALDEDTYAGIVDVVAELTRNVPVERRGETAALLRTQFQAVVRQAIDNGGQDLYLPTAPIRGMLVQMSIVVAVPELPVKNASASDALLAFAGKDPGARAAGIDNELAVRRAVELPEQRGPSGELTAPASRRISYLAAPAAGPVMFVASILRLGIEGEDEIVDALEFLFETMMGTVRFVREEQRA